MNEARSRVLVALDGSPVAATALPVASVVAAQLGATLEILYVRTPADPIEDPRRELRLDGAQTNVVVVDSDDPARAILGATQSSRVQLLVMTTHGRRIEPGRDLGHVANAVVAGATQPILLVRPEAAVGVDKPSELRHLLVPLDGTPTTSSVLRPMADLARRLGASVDLLHVVSPGQELPAEVGSISGPRYVDQPQHEWPAWSGEVAARVAAAGTELPDDIPVQVFLVHGSIGKEITDFARERHIDAIAAACRSGLQPGRAPVLRAILAHTPCPILLVGTT
jgi:nucleotide-binding universal stress UspA family protein